MPSKTSSKPLAWLLLIGWMGLIFFFSHQSALPSLPGGFSDTLFKKIAHASAYAVLMFLWWNALTSLLPAVSKTLWLAFILTILYAASDEWHQTFISGRNGQLFDVLIDALGAFMALLFIKAKVKAKVKVQMPIVNRKS